MSVLDNILGIDFQDCCSGSWTLMREQNAYTLAASPPSLECSSFTEYRWLQRQIAFQNLGRRERKSSLFLINKLLICSELFCLYSVGPKLFTWLQERLGNTVCIPDPIFPGENWCWGLFWQQNGRMNGRWQLQLLRCFSTKGVQELALTHPVSSIGWCHPLLKHSENTPHIVT